MAESEAHRPKEAWDRRRDEPANAYAAFEIYLNLPPGQRTQKEAYRLHTGNQDAAGPSEHFRGWARRHDWEERALAYDDAKAKARFEGELAGIEEQWKSLGAQKEKMHAQLMDLAEAAYNDAMRIYEQELTRDNYSKAHAVQMSKFTLEVYKLLIELERVHKGHEQDRWTEEDERAIAKAMEEAVAMEEVYREDLDPATEFFEEQRRRELEEEEEKGSDEPGNGST